MTISFSRTSPDELRRRWRRQLAGRSYGGRSSRPRDGAALGFRVRVGPLAALSQVTPVLIYDEASSDGRTHVQLVAYRPQLTSAGVDWTGEIAFEKTLSLTPRPYARGRRLDSRWHGLLELALRLDHRLEQAQRHPERMRQTPVRWPRLWASFTAAAAEQVEGQGDEFAALCRKFDLSPAAMLAKFQRPWQGGVLLPADWVGTSGDSLWADLAGVPARQALPMEAFQLVA